ncbi:MAG TPA: TonB family protein [Candidatus Binatia bacterium]
MRNDTLGVPVLASFAIHILVLLLGSVIVHNTSLRQPNFVPIDLVDIPKPENPPPQKKIEAPEIKKPVPPPKIEKPKPPPQIAKAPVTKPEVSAPLPAPIKEQPAKPLETKPIEPPNLEPPASFSPSAKTESGGSEAGAGNLFGKGDVGVVPGTGTAGGGGGTASAGLGRGSDAPGPSAQTVLKTNRLAKPIHSVPPVYPPMALKMGMEGEVTLKIIVDPEGNVSRADIVKSTGTDFNEEATKAVKQSRFEPAQREGRNVPAEFTYIYRFRLKK